ncbi:sulfotransferase domain-containing protein [Litoribrevibacter euphylliae]|uniref:Sulfotransferase domain-containing protein n=1 Tax=Litoribrevibacter euphylliae TaxID=1834034 RepID=A0ABV7H7Y3_9GAMM
MSYIKSIEIDISEAINHYFGSRFSECSQVVSKIFNKDPNLLIPNYLYSLLLYRSGNKIEALDLMRKIDRAFPALKKFNYRHSVLEQQKDDDWQTVQSKRLKEFWTFQFIQNFIISYPKCGRTWLRLLLGKYLLNGSEGDPIEILNITNGRPELPTTEFSHDDYPMWKHIDFINKDKSIYQNKKVIFLIRDPRDVLVSYYFQYTKRKDREIANDNFDGTMGDFLHHPIGGLPSIINFYNIWAENLTTPESLMILTYEELHNTPFESLKETINFLGFPDYGEKTMLDAIEYCQFENMKEIEEKNLLNNQRLRADNLSDPETFKVRKGKIGGYKDYLSNSEIINLEDYINSNLHPFYKQFKYIK